MAIFPFRDYSLAQSRYSIQFSLFWQSVMAIEMGSMQKGLNVSR